MKKKLFVLLCLCAVMILVPAAVLAAADNAIQVGTKEDFLRAVADSDAKVIQVTADIDLSGANVLDVSGRRIDLQGNKISADNFSLIFEGTDFTIQNGTFDAKGGSYALFIGDMGTTDNVVVDNITMNGGINVFNATNVVLRDVNITGTSYYAVWCDEGGQVTIESGSFQTNGVAVLGMTHPSTDSTLSIEGGTFTTDGKPLVLENGDTYGKPVIGGGSFDAPVAEEYCAEGFQPIDNGDGSFGVCSHADTEKRNVKDATCTEAGYSGDIYCKKCKELIQAGAETQALGHHMEHHAAKDASCTEAGTIEYWSCTTCQKNFTDENGAKEVTELESAPALGHSFGEWTVTKEPAAAQEGSREKTCAVCGYTVTESLAALEDTENPKELDKVQEETDVPKTGELNDLPLFLIILLVSAAGFVGTALAIRRKRAK